MWHRQQVLITKEQHEWLRQKAHEQKDSLEVAIGRLQQAGIIASPDYWLENAQAGKTCRGDYVAGLIRNMAGKLI